MRTLVTGGAGFLGSHLCERLLADGHEVICLDNFYSGKRANIAHLRSHPNFEVIRHDIVNPILLEVDRIYSLACPASPVHYQYNPVKTIKTSVMGTVNMLGLAKRVKARILLSSTSEVYGDPQEHPQRESYWGHVNPIGVRSCYDEGKRVAECLMMDYHRQNQVDIRIVRIFNTYGPRMRPHDGRAIPTFVRQALANEPLTVFGDGSQTRSFCYVDDLILGLIALAKSGEHLPVNIGNPAEYTLLELAQRVVDATGATSEIVFEALPVDDPKVRQPDITRARQLLGWEPQVSLEDGLRRILQANSRESLSV
ncbi:MAG TPA: UDP-glucuronic acid decarboxylase family protein [Candidatus Binataceae bacterium]|nr:UDP-glucuronic acid decarboxylase family protein [Candidatus Binataceae bacterium]